MLYSIDQAMSLKDQTFAHLLVKEENHVLTITLNRPEKKNALNEVLFTELAFALEHAYYNSNVWVVVIEANGDVFCAGADLKGFSGQGEAIKSTVPAPGGEVVLGNVFNSIYKPCIAKVHAPVYAGGFLIICGCTHVIAANNATFSLPEVKRGLFPFQVMQSMLQIMPPRTVLDFCMRAKTLNAAEAEKIGLVSKAVEPTALDAEVKNLAQEIMQYSPSAIRLGLEAYHNVGNVEAGSEHNYMKQMLALTIQTEDAAEGMKAFFEKRKPEWTGK